MRLSYPIPVPSLGAVCLALALPACSSADAPSSGPEPQAPASDEPGPGGKADGWSSTNAPTRFRWDYEATFRDLPLEGSTTTVPWSDDYWAFRNGGIAYRWQTGETPFSYGTGPSLSELRSMSQSRIDQLSPAEKYDIYVGAYDYPTVEELKRITSPTADGWEGFCDGWANAAIHYAEPQAVTLTGAGGVTLRFASSDVKALLTYFQSRKAELRRTKIGEPCWADLGSNPGAGALAACEDTNAGAFHLTLANLVGMENQAFVGDITRDAQIWNQPFHAYESVVESVTPASPGSAPETMKEVVVRTTVVYTVEVHPHHDPRHADRTAEYRYRLELDANGDIVGGSWISYDRPDFVWFNPPTPFYGHFEKLGEIYAAATEGEPS